MYPKRQFEVNTNIFTPKTFWCEHKYISKICCIHLFLSHWSKVFSSAICTWCYSLTFQCRFALQTCCIITTSKLHCLTHYRCLGDSTAFGRIELFLTNDQQGPEETRAESVRRRLLMKRKKLPLCCFICTSPCVKTTPHSTALYIQCTQLNEMALWWYLYGSDNGPEWLLFHEDSDRVLICVLSDRGFIPPPHCTVYLFTVQSYPAMQCRVQSRRLVE